jgi:polysaccharide export outer membrane protein
MLIAGLLLVGCKNILSGSQPAPLRDPQSTAAWTSNGVSLAETALRTGDRIRIEFSGNVAAPPWHEEEIKDDGTITLDYIGSIKAADKTPRQLQKEIHEKYVPDYYGELNVTVTPSARFYWVGGEVKVPDKYQYLGPITVMRAIQAAGDFTNFAKKTNVKLIRANGTIEMVNCNDILNNPELDPPVYPGDYVRVERRVF